MASKSEYLKKYLRAKGPPRRWGAPVNSASLKLGSDDESDERLERNRRCGGEARGLGKKSFFQVVRKAANGEKFIFNDSEAEDLPDSDEEEVRVVGDDGQTLTLSEADKKKVAELIAREEGRVGPLRSHESSEAPPASDGATEAFKQAFAIEEPSNWAREPKAASISGALNGRERHKDDLSPQRRTQQSRSPSQRRVHARVSPLHAQQGGAKDPARGNKQDLSPPRRRAGSCASPARTPQDSPNARLGGRASEERDLSPPRRRGPIETAETGGSSQGFSLKPSDTARDLSPPRRREANPPQGDAAANDTSRKIVFRGREGRIISEEEWLTLEGAKGRKKPRGERGPAPVLEWGSGLKQKQDRKSTRQEEEKLAKAPFARYEIDEEYDAALRARDRWADPLAKAPTSAGKLREAEPDGAATRGDSEEREAKPLPDCPHDAPPNRFNIKPGYRWDGVVRGNGYEEERLKAINRRKWEAEMAHMNNTADM
ncbi:hypothetical protein Esti_003785 [Eimeria stiedai]